MSFEGKRLRVLVREYKSAEEYEQDANSIIGEWGWRVISVVFVQGLEGKLVVTYEREE